MSSPSAPAASPGPPRGLMAIGAVGLGFEALVLLLALPAVTTAQRGHVHVGGVVYLAALAVVLIVLAGTLRRPGAIVVASVVQVLVIAGGVVTWPMYAVGLVFAGIWAYWLHLRRQSR